MRGMLRVVAAVYNPWGRQGVATRREDDDRENRGGWRTIALVCCFYCIHDIITYNNTLFWYMYSVSKPVVYIYIHSQCVCKYVCLSVTPQVSCLPGDTAPSLCTCVGPVPCAWSAAAPGCGCETWPPCRTQCTAPPHHG